MYPDPMKIFALQTDDKKLVQSFLSPNEQVVLLVKFSAFLFVIPPLPPLLLPPSLVIRSKS